MPNYRLVNPYIEGEFKTLFDGQNVGDAANKAWSSLSKHFTNNVPQFPFTIEKVKDGKFHHFLVKEQVNGDIVDYSIRPIKVKESSKQVKEFKKKLKEFDSGKTMLGGAKHKSKHRHSDDDDSDSSSSSSDYDTGLTYMPYTYPEQPIVGLWYDPFYCVPFYVPTFVAPLTPYVEIYMNSAFI